MSKEKCKCGHCIDCHDADNYGIYMCIHCDCNGVECDCEQYEEVLENE